MGRIPLAPDSQEESVPRPLGGGLHVVGKPGEVLQVLHPQLGPGPAFQYLPGLRAQQGESRAVSGKDTQRAARRGPVPEGGGPAAVPGGQGGEPAVSGVVRLRICPGQLPHREGVARPLAVQIGGGVDTGAHRVQHRAPVHRHQAVQCAQRGGLDRSALPVGIDQVVARPGVGHQLPVVRAGGERLHGSAGPSGPHGGEARLPLQHRPVLRHPGVGRSGGRAARPLQGTPG